MYYKHETSESEAITIRHARPSDAGAVARLAQRDSAEVPAGELLVAAVGTELRAALGIADGAVLADPFHPTADLVRMLASRAARLRPAEQDSGPRPLRALRRRRSRSAVSPQPAGIIRALN